MGRDGYVLEDEEDRMFDDWVRRIKPGPERFTEYDGQGLLVCTELSHEARAFKVHVDRPSSQWREKRKASIMQSIPNSLYIHKSYRGSWWHQQDRKNLSEALGNSIADREVRKTVGEDEESIWARLQQRWRQHQTRWHRWLPFWRVIDVREVSVAIYQKLDDDRLDVEIDQLDFEAIQQLCMDKQVQVTAQLKEQHQRIPEYTRTLPKEMQLRELTNGGCKAGYDRYGVWRHSIQNWYCPGDDKCLLKALKDTEMRLENLKRQYQLQACFREPSKANTRTPLLGLAQDSCIYDESDLDFALLGAQLMRRVEAPRRLALQIVMGWQVRRRELEALSCTLSTITVVGLSRLALDDWSAAAGFGSLFAGLLTIFLMRAKVSR